MTEIDKEMTKLDYLAEKVGQLGVLLALAEEANELSNAALKLARARKLIVHPTPVTEDDALLNIIEEYNDVVVCALVLEHFDVPIVKPDLKRINSKLERWYDRVRKEEKDAEKRNGKSR